PRGCEKGDALGNFLDDFTRRAATSAAPANLKFDIRQSEAYMFGKKKQKTLGSRLKALFGIGKDQEAFLEELEDLLIEADVGPRLVGTILEELDELRRADKFRSSEDLEEALVRHLAAGIKTAALAPEPGKLNCFLVFGVNGVGKTTSIAKMAKYYGGSGDSDGAAGIPRAR